MNGDDKFAFGFGIVTTVIIMLFCVFLSYTLFRERDIRQKTKEPYKVEIIGTDTTYIYKKL